MPNPPVSLIVLTCKLSQGGPAHATPAYKAVAMAAARRTKRSADAKSCPGMNSSYKIGIERVSPLGGEAWLSMFNGAQRPAGEERMCRSPLDSILQRSSVEFRDRFYSLFTS